MSAQKRCTRCGEIKALAEYGKHAKTRDGRQEQCAPCRRESRRQSDAAYRERNLEEVRRRAAEWSRKAYESDPEKAKAASREWYARNLDEARRMSRENERRRRQAKPSEVREINERARRRSVDTCAQQAFKSGDWTPDEDSIASDASLSATKVALLLGRTLTSVQARRAYLRNPDMILSGARKQTARKSATTLPTAVNKGKEWTGPELETVARYELTSVEIALMLGRTASAVEAQRSLMRVDPRKQRLAGLEGGEVAAP